MVGSLMYLAQTGRIDSGNSTKTPRVKEQPSLARENSGIQGTW
jgi:hypothetical protein